MRLGDGKACLGIPHDDDDDDAFDVSHPTKLAIITVFITFKRPD